MFPLIDLTGKRILIIGATSGIGQATAIMLSNLGASLIMTSRNSVSCQMLLEKLDGNNKCYQFNIDNLDDIEQQIDDIIADTGKLDGLVYCIGISKNRPLKLYKPSMVAEIMNTNFNAFIEVVRCVTKRNSFNKGMRIVGISSIASLQGDKTHTIYSASKAAMDGAVRCLAKELADKEICINTVAPAMVRTKLYDAYLKNYGEGSDSHRKLLARQYLGMGEPEDVASAIAFLLSSASRFITGVCLPVDGGATSS